MAYIPGEWKAVCDLCGFVFLASKLHEDPWGRRVCSKDLDSRHPQEFVRPREERITPPWTRPDDDSSRIAQTLCVNLSPVLLSASLSDTLYYLAPVGVGTSHLASLPNPNDAAFKGISVVYTLNVVLQDGGTVEDSIAISTQAGTIISSNWAPTGEIPFGGVAKFRNIPSQNLWIREQ